MRRVLFLILCICLFAGCGEVYEFEDVKGTISNKTIIPSYEHLVPYTTMTAFEDTTIMLKTTTVPDNYMIAVTYEDMSIDLEGYSIYSKYNVGDSIECVVMHCYNEDGNELRRELAIKGIPKP